MNSSDRQKIDEIWSILRETARRQKERQEELAREDKKRQEEMAQQEKKRREEMAQQEKLRAQQEKLRAQQEKLRAQQEKKQREEMAQQEKKQREEMAQQEKKQREEMAQQEKKRREEFDRHRRETDRRIRKLDELFTSQWGRLMESLVEGDLIKVLGERGVKIENTYTNLKKEYGEDRYEYDIIAANGEEVVVIEVKTTLRVKYVKAFLEDVRKFTTRRKVYKGLTIYGAVAFLRTEEEASRYAESQGLFVIRATGSSASIINKATFKPKLF